MTAAAPASASISAAMSPVWAPEASGWQSWPPTGKGPPARRASSVAGGQIRTSQAGAGCAAARSSSTAAEAARPFIFQLPATSLRRAMRASPLLRSPPC